MKAGVTQVAFGIVVGLLAGGVIWLVSSQPRGQPVTLPPVPSPAPIVVYVSGAVSQPGIYTLPPGSRAADAVAAAGGMLPAANRSGVNLAGILKDGEQVNVPTLPPTRQPGKPTATPQVPPGTGTPGGLININSASQAELESLPKIGPVTAQKIIAYRQAHGPFKRIEDIQLVAGIGPATFEQIKGLITVSP